MSELLKAVEEELERLRASEYIQLTEGWTQSRHYAEGYLAGQMWSLLHVKDMIEASQGE